MNKITADKIREPPVMHEHARFGPSGSLLIGCAAALLFFSGSAVAAQNYTATISQLQPPNANEDCVFFTMTGVSQADPVNSNSPWFAFPRTQTGFTEVYAALLSAKISAATVNVITTGSVAGGQCGNYAGILLITVQ